MLHCLDIVEIKDFHALIDNKALKLIKNFTWKLDKDDGVTMFFITEKQQKTVLNFSLDSLIVTE